MALSRQGIYLGQPPNSRWFLGRFPVYVAAYLFDVFSRLKDPKFVNHDFSPFKEAARRQDTDIKTLVIPALHRREEQLEGMEGRRLGQRLRFTRQVGSLPSAGELKVMTGTDGLKGKTFYPTSDTWKNG